MVRKKSHLQKTASTQDKWYLTKEFIHFFTSSAIIYLLTKEKDVTSKAICQLEEVAIESVFVKYRSR